ncbi:hypothetical protein F4808DRAFT_463926 [Astrocystis sublimbata]|nr:hypothetical protein F4808DRAFT_463926 [Astrocystis sublimbata]
MFIASFSARLPVLLSSSPVPSPQASLFSGSTWNLHPHSIVVDIDIDILNVELMLDDNNHHSIYHCESAASNNSRDTSRLIPLLRLSKMEILDEGKKRREEKHAQKTVGRQHGAGWNEPSTTKLGGSTDDTRWAAPRPSSYCAVFVPAPNEEPESKSNDGPRWYKGYKVTWGTERRFNFGIWGIDCTTSDRHAPRSAHV